MEIVLRTYRDDQALHLSKITRDSFVLHVSSSGFSGSSTFYDYDSDTISRFVDKLAGLALSGSGLAELVDIEGNELRFELNKLGHLEVSGKLIPHSIPHQMLEFGFLTDQTCLAPFVADLKKSKAVSNSSEN